jgi:hypothetical protein
LLSTDGRIGKLFLLVKGYFASEFLGIPDDAREGPIGATREKEFKNLKARFAVFAGSLFSTIDDIDSNDSHAVMRISTVRSTSNDDLLGFRDIETSRTQSSIIPVFLNSPLMPGITSYMDPPQIALHHPNGCPRIFPDQWFSLQD